MTVRAALDGSRDHVYQAFANGSRKLTHGHTWDGAPVSEGAYLVGLEHGLDLSGHRAQLLTRDLVKSADLILTMSAQHRARVAEMGGEDKVRVLGEYVGRDESKAEVSDPFGSDLASYRETYDELQELIGLVVSRVAGTVR